MQLEQQSGIGSLTVFHSFGRLGGMLFQCRRAAAAVKFLQAEPPLNSSSHSSVYLPVPPNA